MAKIPKTQIRIELSNSIKNTEFIEPRDDSPTDDRLLKLPNQENETLAYDSDVSEIQPPEKSILLVRASRAGDSIRVAKLLAKNPEIDVNSTDTLGRSALRIAVKNDHLEVVQKLIKRANIARVYEALLLSIALGHDQISEAIIRNKAYRRCRQMMKASTLHAGPRMVESALGHTGDDSLFSSDITPLMLASQKNQFEIVKLLISKGEVIGEPCPEDCRCIKCLYSRRDELRHAATTLNTFRALSSEAYISIQSQDPILTAFNLAYKLRERSQNEGYFKSQYLLLANSLSDYTVKLLDKVRTGQELSDLLDVEDGQLSRLRLAIKYEEKKFVAHPSCQKKLLTVWLGDMPFQQHLNRIWQLALFVVLLTLCYPFMAICYWLYPWNKIGRYLKVPMVKCTAIACSYILFISMTVAYSILERPSQQSSSRPNGVRLLDLTLKGTTNDSATLQDYYEDYRDICQTACREQMVEDFYLRNNRIGYGTYVLFIWLLGLILQSSKHLYHDGLGVFTQSWYNISDTFMYAFFLAAFTLRFIGSKQASQASSFFQNREFWIYLVNSGCDHTNSSTTIFEHLNLDEAVYYANADRQKWRSSDMYFAFEALYALGIILAVCRLSYLFAIHPRIGPLTKTLSSMVKDIFAFMFIFSLAICGFFFGFNTLYWYHNPNHTTMNRDEEDMEERGITKLDTVEIIFWSIFGMIDRENVKFLQEEHVHSSLTRAVGAVLFALYNWIIVIVLITMLIAMMARSYEIVASAEDVEWKFSRSKLYMDHIRHGPTLCVPFNILPSWKSIFYAVRFVGMTTMAKYNLLKDKSKTTTPTLGELRADSTNPTCDSPEALHAENGNICQLRAVHDDKFHMKTPHEFTMKCIVDRFVAQSTNKTDKNEDSGNDKDSVETLTREICSMRNEVNSALRWHEDRATQMESKLSNIETCLSLFLGQDQSPSSGPAQFSSSNHLAAHTERDGRSRLRRQNSFDLASVAASVTEMKQLMSEFRKEAVEELQEAVRVVSATDLSSKSQQQSLEAGRDAASKAEFEFDVGKSASVQALSGTGSGDSMHRLNMLA